MFSRDKAYRNAPANSETALSAAGNQLTHNEWLRMKELVDRGIAQVSLINGTLIISYDWAKAEEPARQMEMDV